MVCRECKTYTDDPFECPHCGRIFEFDPQEFTDSNPEGWNEYRHECECGECIRYYEVYKFSHYEVFE